MNYHRVILIGTVTERGQRQPILGDGVPYTVFGLEVGDGKAGPLTLAVLVPGRYGETILPYLTEGRHLLVEGRIHQEGAGMYIVADHVRFDAKPRIAENEK